MSGSEIEYHFITKVSYLLNEEILIKYLTCTAIWFKYWNYSNIAVVYRLTYANL